MHTAAAAPQLHWITKVKHLVIDEIFHHVARHLRAVEDAAHHNGIVGGIVVPQVGAGCHGAPSHQRASQQAAEVALVERIKNLVQVENVSLRGEQALAAPHLPHHMSFARQVRAGDMAAITGRMIWVNVLPIQLGQQNMDDGAQHRFGSAFQQVR